MSYNDFAYYYDIMMSNINYGLFIDIVKQNVDKDKCILDVGCGTGTITVELYKEGYNIDGLDLSDEMLSVFQSKIIETKANINLFNQDILSINSSEQYDCIISFMDVINYIEDYKSAFKKIYNLLTNNGIFIFDIDTLKYINSLDGYKEDYDYGDFSYVWECEKGVEENSIIHNLTIKSKDNTYFERHYQRTYNIDTYINALKDVGFSNIEVLDESDINKTFLKITK